MKCIECRLIYYRNEYFLVDKQDRTVRIGDFILTPFYNTFDQVVGINELGLFELKNNPHPFKPSPGSIIIAKGKEIEERFKKIKNHESTFYVYEKNDILFLNHDGTVVMTKNQTDYQIYANQYKPNVIDTLLIGEAPPNNGKNYFYKVPPNYKPSGQHLIKDTSLPSTIFGHYFKSRPQNSREYDLLLKQLSDRKVFLIDMFEAPIEVRNNRKNMGIILSESNLKDLADRVSSLVHTNTKIIFLLARKGYEKRLKQKFSNAKFSYWKDFRI